MQSLGVNVTIVHHELFHLLTDGSFNLQMIKIWCIDCDRVLAEEVSDQHVFDV